MTLKLLLLLTLICGIFSLDLLPIKFNNVHGPKIELLDDVTVARRYEGYCYSVTFTARQLRVGETLHFNITEIENGWMANMNVGILYGDPFDLPPGSTVTCSANITDDIPNTKVFIFEEFYTEDNVYEFRIGYDGTAYLTPNVTSDGVIFTDVDVSKPFWGLLNIFGDSKAVKLLGTSSDKATQ